MNKKEKLSNNWKEVELKDIIKVQSGFAFKSKEFLSKGIPIVRISNFNNSSINLSNSIYYSEDFDVEKNKNYFLEENDILIAMSGATTGKLGFVKKEHLPCLLNQRIGKFKILNESFLDIKYLKFYLKSSLFQDFILKKAFGCAQPNLATKDIETFKVPMPYKDNKPDLQEQKRIVKKLELAEKLKENRTKADELTKEYLNSIFLDMFDNPLINDKNWNIENLNYYGNLSRGKSSHRPRNAEFLYGGKYPFIQTGNIRQSESIYLDKFTQTYSEEGIKQSRLFKKGTIAITIAANIGETVVLSFDCYFPDSVVGFQVKEPLFVSYLLKFYKNKLDSLATNTAQKNINLEILNNLKVICPPIELQNQFAQIVEQVEQLKEYQNKSKEEIDNLFNKLMQQAFKGEL